MTVNNTTPMPSLNSDSPLISASMSAGARTFLMNPSTATGSVGETMAPNRQQAKMGGWTPARRRMP